MTKTQTIFLDRTPYNIQSGSLIDGKTEVLNLLIEDGTPQTDCQLIGLCLEYKPLVWMNFEKQRISNLKELNVVFLSGKLAPKGKKQIAKLFPQINVNYFEIPLLGAHYYFEKLKKQRSVEHHNRKQNCYFSIGTPRLPRFYLTVLCQRYGIDNFAFPGMSENLLRDFTHQLNQLSGHENVIGSFQNVPKRLFGEIPQCEFEIKQMSLLADARINIVSHYPFFDYMTHFYNEQLAWPMLTKTLPFFFDNKNANANIADIGFKPYIGFDYRADAIDNFVERWNVLFEDNKKFFLESIASQEIYRMNKEIIDHNYRVLLETDWKAKVHKELLEIPENLRLEVFKKRSYIY